MPLVFYPDGTTKEVKNLGYLLRNWKVVDRFEAYSSDDKGYTTLRAIMNDGRIYEVDFAAKNVLWNWLKRPVFLGVPLNWFGKEHIISKGGYR